MDPRAAVCVLSRGSRGPAGWLGFLSPRLWGRLWSFSDGSDSPPGKPGLISASLTQHIPSGPTPSLLSPPLSQAEQVDCMQCGLGH